MPILAATAGVNFFYTDSGAPKSPEYTTIVILHGYKWHSAVFARLLPLARTRGIRIICVNRRGYPNSTPYTPEEAAALASTDPSRVLLDQGILLSRFIAQLPDTLQLPQPSDGHAGEIALAGWSLGTLFVQLVLASLDSVDEHTRVILRTRIRRVILWDIPSPFLGLGAPPGAYFPLTDNSKTLNERIDTFMTWVSGYYTHDVASRKPGYGDPDADLLPSVESAPGLLALAATTASVSGDTALMRISLLPLMQRITEGTLLDPQLSRRWGGLQLHTITGSRSVWMCVLAPWWFEAAARKAGIRVEDQIILGANHLVMWDNPEAAIRALQNCCIAVAASHKAHL
ncbi:Alpha/Beta hydrolase protein [Schizophyllum fasciatum]